MNFFLRLMKGPDPFGFDQAPTFQVDHVRGQRLNPAYEDELVAHNPIDLQHLVRYMRSAKVLAWLGNDALAKDDLLLHAELARLSYCELPNNAAGSYIPSTLYHDMQSVAQDPGRGFSFGRGEAWCVDVMSTAYSLGDAEFRSRTRRNVPRECRERFDRPGERGRDLRRIGRLRIVRQQRGREYGGARQAIRQRVV